jgi:hypothetical protein
MNAVGQRHFVELRVAELTGRGQTVRKHNFGGWR